MCYIRVCVVLLRGLQDPQGPRDPEDWPDPRDSRETRLVSDVWIVSLRVIFQFGFWFHWDVCFRERVQRACLVLQGGQESLVTG